MTEIASSGIAIFDTAIGHCSLAWAPRGLVGVQLPEVNGDREAKQARMRRDFPRLDEVPGAQRPPEVVAAIEAIRALLASHNEVDAQVLQIALDEEGVTDFHHRVYAIARRIPPGETRTYGETAEDVGD